MLEAAHRLNDEPAREAPKPDNVAGLVGYDGFYRGRADVQPDRQLRGLSGLGRVGHARTVLQACPKGAVLQISQGERHRAFVTAPMRGPGLDKLKRLAEVVHEPWTDQKPLTIYDGAGLAKRLADEGADIAVVEADFVDGPVFELPLVAVAATRGDPNNVAVAQATAAGVPVLRTPGRNADAVAELAIGLLIAVGPGSPAC